MGPDGARRLLLAREDYGYCEDDTVWARLLEATPMLAVIGLVLVGASWLGAWLFCSAGARCAAPQPRAAVAAEPAELEAISDTIRVLEQVNDLLAQLERELPALEAASCGPAAGEDATRRKVNQVSTTMQLKLTRLADDLDALSRCPATAAAATSRRHHRLDCGGCC